MKLDVFTLFPGWFDWFREQRHVRNALAIFYEQCLPRHIQNVLAHVAHDEQLCRETGTQPWVGTWDLNGDVELASRLVLPEILHRHPGQCFHGSMKRVPRKGIEPDVDILPDSNVAPIPFVDLGRYLHLGRIDNPGDSVAGLGLVAFPIVGQ